MSEETTRRDGLRGHLDLLCTTDSRGLSILRRQSFRAPMHLSKPHLDEDSRTLVVNVVNPTAGLLAGDRITCHAEVAGGARLLLTTPSACRAHRMREGHAEMTQDFSVAQGGFLECWPELFVPQGGTRYRQHTALRVERGGELLFFESLAPGRVASGEAFSYTSLDWETDLHLGDTLVARERYRLVPGAPAVETLRARFATAYYASCFLATPRLSEDSSCWRALHELHGGEVWIGCSLLAPGAWVIKILATGSIALRAQLAEVRRILYTALGTPAPCLRRVVPAG